MASASLTAPLEAPRAGERTAPGLWQLGLEQRRTAPAYLAEEADGWREVTWDEAARRVDDFARGLLARGIGRGDAIAILATTRLDWALLDWAAMSIGAVVVGLYPTSSAAECEYILDHSEAVLAFAEDEAQVAKLRGARLRDVVPFAGLDALAEEGRRNADAVIPEVAEDDVATLIYTSGTTGPPKGCMLTHRNLVAAATHVDSGLTRAGDVVLLFLPLAHSFGRLVHQSAAFHGFTTAFCSDPNRAAEAILAVHPTVLPAVPRVYEKIHAGVLSQLESSSGAKRAIAHWALGAGADAARRRREGRSVPPLLRLKERLAGKLVFAKVKEKLGGRLRLGISGAAPLSVEVLEFFHALGILVVEGYGLTESASSATVNEPEAFRFGTVGRAVADSELRLADDGEILLRSATIFTGYFKDPDATRAALTDDGWLRTGDVGEIDDDGYLKITDRKKDLIITAGGKNISPQNLENALKGSRFVSQALVVGDRRPYVTALITLDDAEVAASGRPAQELVQEHVDAVNRERTRVEQIKRFAILPRDFLQTEDEVTPTLKLKRRVVHEHFADEIEALYR
jgi:long-chain acyl-CoA synthetase